MDEGMSDGPTGRVFQISDAHSPASAPQQIPLSHRKIAFDMDDAL